MPICFADPSWRTRLESLLAAGTAAGADLVEVFLESADRLSLLAEQERVTSVSPSFGSGAGIRVFRGHGSATRDGFVSTNDLSDAGLRQALGQGLGMLGLDLPGPGSPSVFEGLPALRDLGAGREDGLARCPGVAEAAERMLDGTAQLQRHGRQVQARRGSYSRDWQEVLVAASDGTFHRDLRLHQTLGLSLLAADGNHRSSVARRFGSSDDPDDLRRWDAEATALDLAASSAAMLYAEVVEAGTYPVVLANRFGGVIFHEACGHLLETTQIERGTTPFADRLGQPIAHEALTAIDEGLSPGSFGSLAMDDEGLEPQRTVLIENGVLRAFLSDRAGELRTGHRRTGSGRRQSHAFPAASRMRNTFIAAGPHSPGDLIASVDRGLYCKVMGGGSVGPTGQFNFSVEEGYLIENGTLGQPVKGATLIGDAQTVMPRISMCADDLDLAAGFCGSVSGSIYVTVGQPHIKVDAITVGGR
jgi:TldD protein